MADSAPVPDAASSSAVPKIVLVTSTVAWLIGILYILSTLATGIPAVATGHLPFMVLLTFVAGVGYCIAGYRIRKRRRSGATIAMVCAAVLLVVMVLGMGYGLSAGPVLNALMLVLAVVAGRHLPTQSPGQNE